jgi:hypothetical protein
VIKDIAYFFDFIFGEMESYLVDLLEIHRLSGPEYLKHKFELGSLKRQMRSEWRGFIFKILPSSQANAQIEYDLSRAINERLNTLDQYMHNVTHRHLHISESCQGLFLY